MTVPAGEFELIERFFTRRGARREDVLAGVGDDGALVAVPASGTLVFALDTLVEGAHFPAGFDRASSATGRSQSTSPTLRPWAPNPPWRCSALPCRPRTSTGSRDSPRARHARAPPWGRHRRGDTTRGPLTVSVALAGAVPQGQALLREGARAGRNFDLIGIMSYDAIGPTWGTPGDEHASNEQAEKDLRLWLGKGVPAHRLALGLPFYGRGFGSYRQSWSIAEIAEEKGRKALETDVIGKRCAGCDYVTFNGLPTLERKAMLAGAWGAGVMVWEIDEDLPDDRAIRRVLDGHAKGRAHAGR